MATNPEYLQEIDKLWEERQTFIETAKEIWPYLSWYRIDTKQREVQDKLGELLRKYDPNWYALNGEFPGRR